jgi:uncharacterized integral membrane protein
MGSKEVFQPLTTKDKVTVLIYRTGIVMSSMLIAALAFFVGKSYQNTGAPFTPTPDLIVCGLYVSIAMSVFFIHLYIGKFKNYLKNLYFISLACLAVLLFLGKGHPGNILAHKSYTSLFLLPLSGCLGFITAKEAFCFKLFEGYLLAMMMPIYLLLVSGNILTGRTIFYGLVLIAVMLVIFTLRKVTMPIAYDIGDKSAYH